MTAFRLAVVERLREQRLQGCVLRLHAANRELVEAQQLRASLVIELGAPMPPGIRTSDEFAQAATYRQLLRDQIRSGDEVIRRLIAVLDERRQEWLTASAQARAVEALHERHRLARRTSLARQDQKEADELAGARRTMAGYAFDSRAVEVDR